LKIVLDINDDDPITDYIKEQSKDGNITPEEFVLRIVHGAAGFPAEYNVINIDDYRKKQE